MYIIPPLHISVSLIASTGSDVHVLFRPNLGAFNKRMLDAIQHMTGGLGEFDPDHPGGIVIAFDKDATPDPVLETAMTIRAAYPKFQLVTNSPWIAGRIGCHAKLLEAGNFINLYARGN